MAVFGTTPATMRASGALLEPALDGLARFGRILVTLPAIPEQAPSSGMVDPAFDPRWLRSRS